MLNFSLRSYKLVPISVCSAIISVLSLSPAAAQVIWYNGDNDGLDTYYSSSTSGSTGIVYDDFTVGGTGGNVTGVFGNFVDFVAPAPGTTTLGSVTTANWEIRSGVSSGNGGILVASGTAAAATSTPSAGIDANGNYVYTINVSGLNLNLPSGTYWLGLQPISTGTDYGYMVTTSGSGSIGQPAGNDGNSFFSDNAGPNSFAPATSTSNAPEDFSLGVQGAVVPEPSTWALMALGAAMLVGLRSRSVRNRS